MPSACVYGFGFTWHCTQLRWFSFRICFKTSFDEILTLLSFACLSLDRGRYLLERILIINMPFHILSYSRGGNTREACKDSDCEMGGDVKRQNERYRVGNRREAFICFF